MQLYIQRWIVCWKRIKAKEEDGEDGDVVDDVDQVAGDDVRAVRQPLFGASHLPPPPPPPSSSFPQLQSNPST